MDTKYNISSLEPIFDGEYATIVTACSDEYAPYLAAIIKSIESYAAPKNKYDIIILEDSITTRHKDELKKLIDSDNMSVRFVHIEQKWFPIDIEESCRGTHFSKETYFRICSPGILRHYSKICYIDVDVILQDDIYKLYEINLKGKTIGACIDLIMNGWCNQDDNMKEHILSTLKLKDKNKFFQCGVLLIDCERYRNNECERRLLELMKFIPMKTADQDLFNVVFEDDVELIDPAWNYENYCTLLESVKRFEAMDAWAQEAYLKARQTPKIIHFIGPDKPWTNPMAYYASKWWEHVRQTPFYEEIILSLINNSKLYSHINISLYLVCVLNKINYCIFKKHMYRILKYITWGKTRQRFIQKHRKTKYLIKAAKRLRKELSNWIVFD